MPYLFATSRVNFARYGLYYLHSMETFPSEIKHYFLQDQHIMRHTASATNSTLSDMFIETTFMRYGHSRGGLTEITPNDNATQRWAISLHTGLTHAKLVSLTSPCCSGWPAPMNTPQGHQRELSSDGCADFNAWLESDLVLVINFNSTHK